MLVPENEEERKLCNMSLSINLALALLRPTGELLVTNYRVKKIEFEVELEIELV